MPARVQTSFSVFVGEEKLIIGSVTTTAWAHECRRRLFGSSQALTQWMAGGGLVVDKNLVPDLSLRLFIPEILNRTNTDQAPCLKTQPECLSVNELPYWRQEELTHNKKTSFSRSTAFSFGSVKDFSFYKVIAFLGWKTNKKIKCLFVDKFFVVFFWLTIVYLFGCLLVLEHELGRSSPPQRFICKIFEGILLLRSSLI